MNDVDKLRLLLPHWIEHNAEHAAQYAEWAGRVPIGSEHIHQAIRHVEAANRALQAALDSLGEPASDTPLCR
jgi:hypothetical protein